MKYSEGRMGRVFVVKIEDGDNLVESIKELARKEQVNSAAVFMVGALRQAEIVVGPVEPVLPPDPVWKGFDDAREIIGIGTLFKDGDDPNMHLHIGAGRGDVALVGCLRNNGKAYILVEVIILEITGTDAVRSIDPETGLKMLNFLR